MKNTDWDLSLFYQSVDDPQLQRDEAAFAALPEQCKTILKAAESDGEKLKKLVELLEETALLHEKIEGYLALTLSVNAADEAALKEINHFSALTVPVTMMRNEITRFVGGIADLDAIRASDEKLTDYRFVLNEMKEQTRHLPPKEAESWMLRLRLDGADAFSKLRDALTGTLTANVNGKELPLPAVRGMAYDPNPAVRKAAYEAELRCYKKVDTAMAYCLGCIKGDAATFAEACGYPDVLTQQLEETRMDQETLNALIAAIQEFLPDFRRYLRKKAELLGHKNGLPFYDLFAPLGESTAKYTIEEARDLLVDTFGKVHPGIAELMDTAFSNRWIDFLPKEGKEGGAFCAGFYHEKVSRVLTNFTGSFSDVSTLAHELGHAWHNRNLERVRVLNTNVPMPLAETASIFNETLLAGEAMRTASEEERFALLEGNLMENTQTVVDILSRFLFEKAVFETRKSHIPTVDEINRMMLDAQEAAYGDGLDPEFRHPYMWLCKSHYYSVGLHFYNFPYAFGMLFGLGIYQKYQQEGQAFLSRYDDLLSRCGSAGVADVAASVGIDVRSIEYWRGALKVIRGNINEFCRLADRRMIK